MEKPITNYYKNLTVKRNDPEDLRKCIVETVDKLKENETTFNRPGMLLGKIQSGKTRAFIGVIACAFDSGYDISIVLTKGTKALTEQTLQRLNEDFSDLIENDQVQVFDILQLPENLSNYELQQKIVVVVKKEINNMKRIIKALTQTYPDLTSKKILIIDDEADFASLSFRRDKETGEIEQGKIAEAIDDLRSKSAETSFLQVTATPYSLYLQSESEIEDSENMIFKPKKPVFTQILPIHNAYIGGDYYFGQSDDPESTAYYVYEEITPEEREVLKKQDFRRLKLEEILTSKAIKSLRKAIITFIVGGVIRRAQQAKKEEVLEKYSFVIHTEMAKRSHDWQVVLVSKLIEMLQTAAVRDSKTINDLINDSIQELSESLNLLGINSIDLVDIKEDTKQSLQNVMIARVNSDNDVAQLLDAKGQLKLRTPFNIFIGGQILDRGITIKNLIGFYYGRNPQRFQQDTVLQHSRMYGVRSSEDLAVTRLYTTERIYETMRQINEFDEALREAFLKGAHDNGVYFIRKDESNRLISCSPNKILLSDITTIKPHKRFLPIGFQTGYKTNIRNIIEEIDNIVSDIKKKVNINQGGFLIDSPLALVILRKIHSTLEYDDTLPWDIKGVIASLEHLSKLASVSEKNKVWVIIRENMNMSRIKEDGRYSDDPDGGRAEGSSRNVARKLAVDIPAIILTRQNGEEDRGWRGSPFWWPIVVAPRNTPTSIFASEVREE